MFSKKSPKNFREPGKGIKFKAITHGEKTLMAEFFLDAGAALEEHSHPHEQTGYLISGKLIFKMEGQSLETEAGDSWTIAGDVPHAVDVVEDAHVIEVFTPVREDFLD